MSVPRLFGCVPLGRGGVEVESLIGFFARLCLSRCVLASKVANRLVVPLCPSGVFPERSLRMGAFLSRQAARFDAQPHCAVPFANALETLTWLDDLVGLTFAPWHAFFAAESLHMGMRTYKCWCAACFAAWDEGDLPLYEPLAWRFAIVSRCPVHRTALLERCPHCAGRQPLVTQGVPIGFCVRCGHALRGDACLKPVDEASLAPQEGFSLWRAVAFSRLLAHSSVSGAATLGECGSPASSNGVRRLLSHALSHPPAVWIGSRLALACALGLYPFHLYRILDGESHPSVPLFIDLSMQLGVDPLRVLLDAFEEGERTWPGVASSLAPCADPWTFALEVREHLGAVRHPERAAALDAFIADASRYDLGALMRAERTIPISLDSDFPLRMARARVLRDERAAAARRALSERFDRALDAAIDAGGVQSLSDVAESLGVDLSALERYSPERYARLSALRQSLWASEAPGVRNACAAALKRGIMHVT